MIGIIPAAGRAERMGGIPKFLLPVPGGTLLDVLSLRMNAVAQAFVITVGNSDNIQLLRARAFQHCDMAISCADTNTMSETVLASSTWFGKNRHDVLFGMPDTYFEDDQAFIRLAALLDNGADVAVGMFRTRPEQRSKLGMCEIGDGYEVRAIYDKPIQTTLEWAWGVLAWKPVFWQYIHAEDPAIGYALTHAIDAGLDVRAVQMEGGYWDCGTPDEYFALIRYLTEVRDAV